jgi:hypothetical protein
LAGATLGIALSRRAAGHVATGVRTTRAAGTAVSGGAATVARAPIAARTRATERSQEVRQRLRSARAAAGRARHPFASSRNARDAAESAAHDRTDWM